MNNILLPTDGSILADFAYDLAHDIANRTASYIDVLAIVPAPSDAIFDRLGKLTADEGEDHRQLREQQKVIKERLTTWVQDKPDVRSVTVKIGRIEEDIVRYATEKDIDLIIMGTEGSHGLKELFIGSHTEHVVRSSPVPVLSLKSDRSKVFVKNLLLIGDFENIQQPNLTMIKELQRSFKARVHLLRINTPKSFLSTRKAMTNMQDFVAINGLDNVQTHIYCDESIEDGIVNFSQDNEMDVLMIGTHQRKGIDRLLTPSISEGVVNHIQQPILTFQL